MGQKLGKYLRALRQRRGLGLKRAAPELQISYTYLSKLENGKVEPSDETMERLARYYSVAVEDLPLTEGRLPPDVRRILEDHPEEAIDLLRRRFGR